MTQRNTTVIHATIAGLQPVAGRARVSGLLISLVLVLLITTGGAG